MVEGTQYYMYFLLHVLLPGLIIVFEKYHIRKFSTINNIVELLQFSVLCVWLYLFMSPFLQMKISEVCVLIHTKKYLHLQFGLCGY